MFEIVKDKSSWMSSLASIGQFDFYHTYDFHEISSNNGEGSPLMLVHRTNDGEVDFIWPLLERAIPGSDGKDLTSVYGYPGPLAREPEKLALFIEQSCRELISLGYVSVFARLHPIYNQTILEKNDFDYIQPLSEVVVIALRKSDDEQVAQMRKNLRRDIRSLENKGCSLKISKVPADVKLFNSIYTATMKNLGAQSHYFFPELYLENLIKSEQFDAFFAFVIYGDQTIASAIIVCTGEMVQYHLSGSLPEFHKLGATKYLLNEIRKWATKEGYRWFFLGGGVGSQRDSLFNFKHGFSRQTFPFGVIKKILLQDEYEKLVLKKANEMNVEEEVVRSQAFFPSYRVSEIQG